MIAKTKKILAVLATVTLVLGVFFVASPEKAYAAPTTYYVDGLDGDDLNSGLSWEQAKLTIQAAIDDASADDTVMVAATNNYPESITIDKTLTLIGKKADKVSDAWDTGVPGAVEGPQIMQEPPFTILVSLDADDIVMMGFELDTSDNAVYGVNVGAVGATIDNALISYCSFTLEATDKGVAVNNNYTLTNSAISQCSFEGPTGSTSEWFTVGSGTGDPGDGGSVNGMSLSANYIYGATSKLLLDREIIDVNYSGNRFFETKGGIFISEPDIQNTNKLGNIDVNSNYFFDGTSLDEYAVYVANDIEDADILSDNWMVDLQINENAINTFGLNNTPSVGFQAGAARATDIDARDNFWGMSSGPYNSATNPNGNGPEVGDDVIYNPYDITWAWTEGGAVSGKVAMTEFDSKFYQAKTTADKKLYTRSSANGLSWSSWVYGGKARNNISMVVFNNKLYQAVRGASTDTLYARSTSDGTTWSSWAKHGTCKAAPVMIVFNSKLFQTKRAYNNGFYTRYSSNGTTWSSWVKGGSTTGSITMASSGGKLYQSVKGLSSNTAYLRSSANGTTWSAWTNCGTTLGEVSLASFGGKLYQAKRASNGYAYTRSSANGTAWSAWVPAGTTVGNVGMIPFNSRLYQFKRMDSALIYFRYSTDGTSWSDWIIEAFGSSDVSIAEYNEELYQGFRTDSGILWTTAF